jgi:hypothetical protein
MLLLNDGTRDAINVYVTVKETLGNLPYLCQGSHNCTSNACSNDNYELKEA